jgi:septin family protein
LTSKAPNTLLSYDLPSASSSQPAFATPTKRARIPKEEGEEPSSRKTKRTKKDKNASNEPLVVQKVEDSSTLTLVPVPKPEDDGSGIREDSEISSKKAHRFTAGSHLLPVYSSGVAPYSASLYPWDIPDKQSISEFTLLVAGCRGGKTAFLRLLLDTSVIAPSASTDQLVSVVEFVQGSSSHTAFIRSTSVDISVNANGSTHPAPLRLSLVDTPAIDFRDELTADYSLSDILRFIDTRFAESQSLEDDCIAQSGDRNVHLCIYFLDPDRIVTPPSLTPPAPLLSRGRGHSLSQPDQDPIILEPPVMTNPLLCRPVLPQAEVAAIKRLSQRVNVLPVVSKADNLPNDRLAAVQLAIRNDLANAGIGFGIFDMDAPYQPKDDLSPSLLRLPYALISPDQYCHSEGVQRLMPSTHELLLQYAPSYTTDSKTPRGKFLRSYRWGCLDVLDQHHSDFMTLRTAIFYHCETLQNYTRSYLFQKFKEDYQVSSQTRPTSHYPSVVACNFCRGELF